MDSPVSTVLLEAFFGEELEGIPCAFPNAAHEKLRWSLEAKHFLTHLELLIADFESQAKQPALQSLTRERLKHFIKSYQEHLQIMRGVLAPFGPDRVPMHDYQNYFRANPLSPNAGPGIGLVQYYPNVHRDWAWSTDENARTLSLLKEVVPVGTSIENLLCLGAGACRLPYDFHRAFKIPETTVTDINPFLLLTAKKLIAGETLELYDFPILPRDLASYAVKRTLKAPEMTPGIRYVLSDITQPCFKPTSFDCILTSWFIDAIPMDIQKLFPLINGLLKPGGFWLNLGPLMFKGPFFGFYSLEETLNIAEKAGFSVGAPAKAFLPYLRSPDDLRQRTEGVVAFSARKTEEVSRIDHVSAHAGEHLPEWLTNRDAPVPLSTDLKAMAGGHLVNAAVFSLVDGEASLNAIITQVASQLKISREYAEIYAVNCLTSFVRNFRSNPHPKT